MRTLWRISDRVVLPPPAPVAELVRVPELEPVDGRETRELVSTVRPPLRGSR